MAGTGKDRGGRKPGGALTAIGTLLVLFVVLMAVAGQIGAALLVAGLVVLGVGLVAAIRGEARWASIVTRRIGFAVAGAGLVALVAGAATMPAPPTSTAAHTSARSLTDGVATAAPRPTTPHRRAVAVTPAPAPAVVATTPPPTPVPQLAMSCPAGGSSASPVFGQQISATAPYSVAIDYGDGDHYTNDDQHLTAIFSHTYHQSGAFVVTAVLSDATGQTATSTCTYSWARPVVVAGSGSSRGSGGTGSSGDTYTNVDGNQIPGPVSAAAPPAGATAQCNDGTYSFSQHHQGTCSSHGGVARWLG